VSMTRWRVTLRFWGTASVPSKIRGGVVDDGVPGRTEE
jgi:hypothetical protein